MARRTKPNRLRFLAPLFYSLVPLLVALLWRQLTDIVAATAHIQQPDLPLAFAVGVAVALAVGLGWSSYRYWRDFVCGDYYLALAQALD